MAIEEIPSGLLLIAHGCHSVSTLYTVQFQPPLLLSGFQAPDAPVCHPKLAFICHPRRAFICHPGRDPGSMAHKGRLQMASPHTGSRLFARDDKRNQYFKLI
jgi:hypothetical protein